MIADIVNNKNGIVLKSNVLKKKFHKYLSVTILTLSVSINNMFIAEYRKYLLSDTNELRTVSPAIKAFLKYTYSLQN